MDNDIYNPLVRDLADRVNKIVNIPLVNEENEQIFFELVVTILLQLFLDTLDNN
nr:hypothetical protein [Candidatus Cloacimonadota bacterium]